MNQIVLKNDKYTCTCGASCKNTPKEKGRFLRRHPFKCRDKELTHKLVETKSPSSTVIEEMIEEIDAEGKNLTDWEVDFMLSIHAMNDKNKLSPKQMESLKKIYTERVWGE